MTDDSKIDKLRAELGKTEAELKKLSDTRERFIELNDQLLRWSEAERNNALAEVERLGAINEELIEACQAGLSVLNYLIEASDLKGDESLEIQASRKIALALHKAGAGEWADD